MKELITPAIYDNSVSGFIWFMLAVYFTIVIVFVWLYKGRPK